MTSRPRAEIDAPPPPPCRGRPIDGQRAYGYLKQICDLGPRPGRLGGQRPAARLVADHFRAMGAAVREQRFTRATRSAGRRSRWPTSSARGPRPGRARGHRRPLRHPPLPRPRPRPGAAQGPVPRGQRRGLRRRPVDGDRPSPERPAHPLGRRPRPVRRRGAGLRPGRRLLPRLQGVRPRLPGGAQEQAGPVALRRRPGARHGRRPRADIPQEPYSLRFNPRLVREVWPIARASAPGHSAIRRGRRSRTTTCP
jgi:hypothetical protein